MLHLFEILSCTYFRYSLSSPKEEGSNKNNVEQIKVLHTFCKWWHKSGFVIIAGSPLQKRSRTPNIVYSLIRRFLGFKSNESNEFLQTRTTVRTIYSTETNFLFSICFPLPLTCSLVLKETHGCLSLVQHASHLRETLHVRCFVNKFFQMKMGWIFCSI